jgi:hypothetical protein
MMLRLTEHHLWLVVVLSSHRKLRLTAKNSNSAAFSGLPSADD